MDALVAKPKSIFDEEDLVVEHGLNIARNIGSARAIPFDPERQREKTCSKVCAAASIHPAFRANWRRSLTMVPALPACLSDQRRLWCCMARMIRW